MDEKIKAELYKVLKHFTIQQIYKHVIEEIPEIAWEDVLNKIKDKKKRHNLNEIINVLILLISKLRLNEEKLLQIIDDIDLLSVMVTGKKKWNVFKLIDHRYQIPTTVSQFKTKLIKALRNNGITTKITMIDYQGKFVASIAKRTSPRKKQNQMRFFNPVFYIFDPQTQYFLSTKLITDNTFSTTFCNCLGYRHFKFCKLSGKNVNDLMKLLRYKDNNRERLHFETPEFVPKIKVNEYGTDYTQNIERKNYGNQLYGEKPPQLQSLTFAVNNHVCCTDLMKGQTMSTELRFVSTDVIGMIKDLMVHKVIDTPPPDYLKNVLMKGKNILQARSDETNM